MPHIHLFTSADLVENVDIPDILRALVEELSRQESIDAKSIKAYHTLLHTWAMGEGASPGFVHCQVSILARPELLKSAIADAMHQRLKLCFAASLGAGEAALTLELREMDGFGYRKGSA